MTRYDIIYSETAQHVMHRHFATSPRNKHMDHQAELANQIRDVCERSDAEDARNAKINEMENNQVLAQHHASRRWAKKQAEEEDPRPAPQRPRYAALPRDAMRRHRPR